MDSSKRLPDDLDCDADASGRGPDASDRDVNDSNRDADGFGRDVDASDGADFTRPAAPGNGSLPAPAAVPAVSAPPAAARRKMRGRGEVLNDLDEAFPQLPEVFDKRDVTRVLGYEPARATLFRALRQLMDEGAVAMEDQSLPGTILTAFRKIRT